MTATLQQQLPRTALAKVPRQQRSVEMVHAILDAAKRVLEREGTMAFTTNRVAQVAGVSVGSLYQYFPNKDALLLGAPGGSLPACETAVPDPNSFDGSAMLLGIVPSQTGTLIELDAWVSVNADGRAFSVEMQTRDPDTDEVIGPMQYVDDVLIDERGLFQMDELVLELPAGVAVTTEGEQTALANVAGGFCATTGDLQGSYEGWTFAPSSAETDGAWFIARVTVSE